MNFWKPWPYTKLLDAKFDKLRPDYERQLVEPCLECDECEDNATAHMKICWGCGGVVHHDCTAYFVLGFFKKRQKRGESMDPPLFSCLMCYKEFTGESCL